MISRIFIDRPIFAWVIAIVIMLAGAGGILSLPVEQYPDIAPPSVNVRATYPGASADTLENSVTQVIEQQLLGINGLLYFSSSSNADGQATITVTFEKGTDPDIAQVQVQNKVQQALPRLPQQVQQQGLIVTKSNQDILMVVAIYDESDRSTSTEIGDYMISNLQEPLGRIPGVGDVVSLGAQHAMRIWLDPVRLASFQLMPRDVVSAIQAQNTQVAAGQIGSNPSPRGQMLNATVTARSRLQSVDQFKAIILKTERDGSRVRLEDVARVELGTENYGVSSRMNRHPAAGAAFVLAPGSDALTTSAQIRQLIEQRSASFPSGYHYVFPNDGTRFIRLSIEEVVKTLVGGIILVVLVMFLFLQSWRVTLIPAVAVPVVLLGTFGVLAVAGFSINTLTLFGLALSIGMLVDDAIVVVENVERVMREDKLPPREATIKSMGEIQTALVAIALVLTAAFLPMAFFGGSVGVIYRQFSITIVSSMLLSIIVAMVLTPALTATVLKPHDGSQEAASRGTLRHAYRRWTVRFNSWLQRMIDRYRDSVCKNIRRRSLMFAIYALCFVMLALVFTRLPTSFLPTEDQGYARLQVSLPPGATQQRTEAALRYIEEYFLTSEKNTTNTIFTVSGTSPQGNGQNTGRGFLGLKPWNERKGYENSLDGITARVTKDLSKMRDVQAYLLAPPPIPGLGQSGGFTMQLLNTGNLTHEQFADARDELLGKASADPALTAVRLGSLQDNPTLQVHLDDAKIGALGLSQSDVDSTLSVAWGGNYVNDFIDKGRVKRVYVQGDSQFRSRPEDLAGWFVRTSDGTMAPFSAFATTNWGRVANSLQRFNGTPSYQIQGDAAKGQSSGDAMDRIEALASRIPGVSVAWSGLSYQEHLSGGRAPYLYAVSLMVIFLCLAALFESWSVPLVVMLIIPLGLLGATLAVKLRGLDNDIYFQVGLLTTMGLSAKNAILIVEFAEQAMLRGASAYDAAIEAARLRIRPIVMTSLAFMFGVLPLAISTGPGAKSRVAIGTAVMGGMLTATVLAIFFVPFLFVIVRRWFGHTGPEPETVIQRQLPA